MAVFGQADFVSDGANQEEVDERGLYSPADIAVDSTGGVYVVEGDDFFFSDTSNNRVVYYANDGDKLADRVYGQNDSFYTGDDGTSQTTMREPLAIALDSDDTLYVADSENNRVLAFNDDGDTVADAVFGQPDFVSSTANNGGVTASSLSDPRGVAVNTAGLYVADTDNNRVLFYARVGGVIDPAADRVYGQFGNFNTNVLDNDGAGGSFGGPSADNLDSPTDVVPGNGGVYIADRDNNRVLYYAGTSTTATRVYGQLNGLTSGIADVNGVTADSLDGPSKVEVDGTGVYISDRDNNRVLFYAGFTDTTADRVYGHADFSASAANDDGTDTTGTPMADSLDQPEGILSDGTTLYIADRENNRVLVFSGTSTTASDVFGQRTLTNGGVNRFAIDAYGLNLPNQIVVDDDGGLYVADNENNRVLYYANDGDMVADTVYGQPDFSSNVENNDGSGASGFPSAENMNDPTGVALDNVGGLYVADNNNHRVLYFADDGDTTADDVFGQASFFTSVAGTSATALNHPFAVAVDENGGLYVSDSNNDRVLYYANDGNRKTADKVFGQADFNTGTAGTTSATSLATPSALVLGRGGLFVADFDNDRVLFYSDADIAANTTAIPASRVYGATTAGDFTDGSGGLGRNLLDNPNGIAVNNDGVYISDQNNHRVLFYPEDSVEPTQVFGQPDFTTETTNFGGEPFDSDRKPTAENLTTPRGLALGPGGTLYIADSNNHRVLAVEALTLLVNDVQSVSTEVYGQPDFNGNGANGGDVSGWGFNRPADMDMDSTGGIYVADQNNNRVLYFANDGDDQADFVYGQDENLFDNDPDNNGLSAESLDNPRSVAVAPGDAGIYVADSDNSRVLYFANDGDAVADQVYGQPDFTSSTGAVGQASLNFPVGLAVDSTGLYVADTSNNRVVFFASAAGVIDNVIDTVYGQITANNFTVGVRNNNGSDVSGVPSAQNLDTPYDVALGNGGLYVADWRNNRVLFYADDGDVTADQVYGQFGDFTTGTADKNGQSNRTFNNPVGLAVDSSGGLYVSDDNNHRVLYFENVGGTVDDLADRVYGQPDFFQDAVNQDFSTVADDTGSVTAETLYFPYGLLATSGGLYVADHLNHRVVFYSGTATVASDVLGQFSLLNGDANRFVSTGNEATLNDPRRVQVDSSGGVYVSDHGNNRVLYYANDGDTLADRVFGQPDFRSNTADNGGLTASTLDAPYGLLLDEDNDRLYVVDSDNNRVLYYILSEANEVADGVFGQSGLFTTSISGTAADTFNQPRGIAMDVAGNLYVADWNNNRVLYFANVGGTIDDTADKVFGQPDFTTGVADNGTSGGIDETALDGPLGVAVGNGGVYIADSDNDRVLFYSDATVAANDVSIPADQVYGAGPLDDFDDQSGTVAQDELNLPFDVVVDSTGPITGFFVADLTNNRVLFFQQDRPLALDVFGQPDFTTSTANFGGPTVDFSRRPNETNLDRPQGLAFGPDGRLFIADGDNHRVLRVSDPPTGLSLDSNSPVALGATSYFTASLTAGTLVTYTWDLDNNSPVTVTNTPFINTIYATPGNYSPIVTATNELGVITDTGFMIISNLPITGLAAEADPFALVGGTANFTATVTGGTNITYDWNFGDGTIETDVGETPTHSYATPGAYTVIVTATNPINEESASTTIDAIENISGLALLASNPTPVVSNTVSFTATLASGSDVTYEFDFGDGSPVVSGSSDQATHIYDTAGSYTAIVTASNVLGSDSSTVSLNVSDEPIDGLALTSSTPTALGNSTTFTATTTAGTNISYEFNFGDSSSTIINTTGVVEYTYGAAGSYSAVVTASNSVGSENINTAVEVEAPISGLSATSDTPTALGDSTTFTATVTGGTNVTYEFDFGDGSTPITNDTGVASNTYATLGTYTTTITASNQVSTLTVETVATVEDAPITGLALTSDAPTVLGDSTTFTATVTGGTNVTYEFDFDDGSTPITNDTGVATNTYAAPGDYTVTVTASNGTNTETTTTTITVLDEEITGLALTSDAPTVPGNSTTFTATVTTGTNVTYEFDFGDSSAPITNTTGVVEYTYAEPGDYTVTVAASNSNNTQTDSTDVSVVDEQITGLALTSDAPTALGDSTTFTAMVTGGTNVTYEFDFGDGSPTITSTTGVVEYTYGAADSYIAVVTASNSAGSENINTTVEVEAPISGLSATSDAPTTLGDSTTFTATVTGGTNVTYEFDFGDDSTPITNDTGVAANTYGAVGDYTVSVTASNQVSTLTVETVATVEDAPITDLALTSVDAPTVLGETTTFTATVTGGTNVTYEFDFGDDSTPIINNTGVATNTYTAPGNYTVTITASNGTNTETATTTITVLDEEITGLALTSDAPTTLGETTTFTATVTDGTNVTYEFDFGDGSPTITNTTGIVEYTYGEAGSYSAVVTASNSVGSENISTTVEVEAPISGLSATSDAPTTLGDSTTFTATVTTGTNVTYEFDFGDDSPIITNTTGIAANTYGAVGDYTVSVTASNQVSTLTADTVATVEDAPITGLALTSDAPTVLGDSTTFTATVTGGTNVTYEFDFGDDSTPITNDTGVATNTYAAPGDYTVTVTASNGTNTETATTTITVLDEEITGLALTSDAPTVLGDSTTFTATVTGGTNVTYEFNFGDGSAIVTNTTGTASYVYASADTYTAIVTATNNASTDNATTSVLIAEELGDPITGLALTSDAPTVLGETTTFTATVTGGANVTYEFNFGDGSAIVTNTTGTASYVYASADTYTAIVTATNDVSTDSATTSVLIAEELDDPITGLVLTSDAPTVLGETTTFNATTTGGTNIIYEWNFGDGNSTTGSDSTVEHTYPEAGVYTATVTARNTASNVTASTQVEIVQEGAVTLYLPLIWQ